MTFDPTDYTKREMKPNSLMKWCLDQGVTFRVDEKGGEKFWVGEKGDIKTSGASQAEVCLGMEGLLAR